MSAPQIIATGRCLPSALVTNGDLRLQADIDDESDLHPHRHPRPVSLPEGTWPGPGRRRGPTGHGTSRTNSR